VALIKGIDVSSVQGRGFDWRLAAADGVRFAICKAGGCNSAGAKYQDPTFVRNNAEARASGIAVGAYWFFSPAHSAAEQADRFAAIIGTVDQLPPVIDFEVRHGAPVAQCIERAEEFVERIESVTGRPCIVYTYPSFWRELGVHSTPLASRPLWIAHYKVDPVSGLAYPLAKPSVPSPWNGRYYIWQTSGNRGPRIPGIPVDVDRNEAEESDIKALLTMRAGTSPRIESDAEAIQRLLNERGASLVVDGKVGPKTLAAMRAYLERVA
jgi:lysozyme